MASARLLRHSRPKGGATDSPNGKLGLAQVVLTGCLGIPKSLPDDVFKVRVHAGMRAQPEAKEKPRYGVFFIECRWRYSLWINAS
jgi:hypothetical protein